MKQFAIFLIFSLSLVHTCLAETCLSRLTSILHSKIKFLVIHPHSVKTATWEEIASHLHFFRNHDDLMSSLSKKRISFPQALALTLFHLDDPAHKKMVFIIRKLLARGLAFGHGPRAISRSFAHAGKDTPPHVYWRPQAIHSKRELEELLLKVIDIVLTLHHPRINAWDRFVHIRSGHRQYTDNISERLLWQSLVWNDCGRQWDSPLIKQPLPKAKF